MGIHLCGCYVFKDLELDLKYKINYQLIYQFRTAKIRGCDSFAKDAVLNDVTANLYLTTKINIDIYVKYILGL